jgi:hypothetical protein
MVTSVNALGSFPIASSLIGEEPGIILDIMDAELDTSGPRKKECDWKSLEDCPKRGGRLDDILFPRPLVSGDLVCTICLRCMTDSMENFSVDMGNSPELETLPRRVNECLTTTGRFSGF